MKIKAIGWVLLCGVAGLTAGPQHYLPTAGPNPFRFRPTPPSSLPPGLLPRLDPEDPVEPRPPPAPITAAPGGEAVVGEPVPDFLELPEPAPVESALPAEPFVPREPPPAEPTPPPLTPQMLLHYFEGLGGTNQAVVSLPVLFTPPLPDGADRSSSASYSSPPAARPGSGAAGSSH